MSTYIFIRSFEGRPWESQIMGDIPTSLSLLMSQIYHPGTVMGTIYENTTKSYAESNTVVTHWIPDIVLVQKLIELGVQHVCDYTMFHEVPGQQGGCRIWIMLYTDPIELGVRKFKKRQGPQCIRQHNIGLQDQLPSEYVFS